jgi:signal transduction histidine kinase/GGDEF domain-containing protein
MPNMTGLQLVAEIAKSRPETLTVLMTGQATIDSALAALKQGASDYLTKPLNLEELVVRLQKVLAERQRFVRLQDFAAQLERANEELKRIDEMKSEFISVASHELRTPLTAIDNALQLLLKGKTGEINETQAKFLSMAERNIHRLTNILNELLDLSRMEAGKMEMKFEELDLRGPIEFILSSLKPQADGKSVVLKIQVAEALPPVYTDREKVEQILTNLIGNAIKFTPEGGEVKVTAGLLDGEGKMVAISVKDSGIGIPKDQQGNVFQKFYQVENSLVRSASGTGLGLAISKGLVEALQGKIWVESEVGKGSTFTFMVPTTKGERRDPHFRLTMDKEMQRAETQQTPLTLFLIGVSDPREEVQDALLARLEERVKKCLCRKADVLLRREKEKLLAAFCECDQKGARVILRRIEEEMKNLLGSGGEPPPVIKVGAATYPEEALCKRELFRLAKRRLMGGKDESEKDPGRR